MFYFCPLVLFNSCSIFAAERFAALAIARLCEQDGVIPILADCRCTKICSPWRLAVLQPVATSCRSLGRRCRSHHTDWSIDQSGISLKSCIMIMPPAPFGASGTSGAFIYSCVSKRGPVIWGLQTLSRPRSNPEQKAFTP